MPEPLPMPGDRPPVLSAQNVGKSPITTVAAVLAAVAQYLTINGADVPQDTRGWLSLGVGILIAAVGALIRDPRVVARTTPVLILCLLVGCKTGDIPPSGSPGSTGPTGSQTQAISSFVIGATMLACSLTPASDRPAVHAGLVLFNAMLMTDPTIAMQLVETPGSDLNQNIGIQWIWHSIHNTLNSLGPDGWSAYGAVLMRQAVIACIQTLGMG